MNRSSVQGFVKSPSHRYCASVGEHSYKALADGAQPFLCFCCFRAQKDEQVAMLVSAVESLKEEINVLKTANSVERPSVARADLSSDTMRIPAPTPISKASKADKTSQNHDKKFNAVLYGVQECSSSMSKSARFESDLTSIVNILSSLDSSIQSQSIKDCYRLGKFSTGASRPRPLLIKFVRVADVTSILSKKRNLSNPYSLKPDMSSEQRLQESVLMKERWILIQAGTERRNIRIRGNSLYVCGNLHGRVINSKFEHIAEASSLPQNTSNSPRCNSPIVQQDQQLPVFATSPANKLSSTSLDDHTRPQPTLSASSNHNPTSVTQVSTSSTLVPLPPQS